MKPYYKSISKNLRIGINKYIEAILIVQNLNDSEVIKAYTNNEILKIDLKWNVNNNKIRSSYEQMELFLTNEGGRWIVAELYNGHLKPLFEKTLFFQWVKEVVLFEYENPERNTHIKSSGTL